MKMLKQGAVTDDMVEKINAAVEDADIDYLLEEVPASLEQSLTDWTVSRLSCGH